MTRLFLSAVGSARVRRYAAWAWSASLLFLLPMQPAWAAKRVALLIGNAQYSVGRLTNPPQDVREIEAALTAVGFGEVETVFDADQKAMKRAIRDFGKKAEGAEIAFLYYSGHGTQANGENYLIPVGASIDKEADYEIEAVSANAVMRQIANARPKATIVVLDACRDNPVALSRSGTKGLSRMDAPTGTMIAFSTAPNTTASDQGYYAKVLARQIRTPGLEVLDVFRNTTSEVMRLSGGRQEPRMSEVSITERVYFLPQQVASIAPSPAFTTAPFGEPMPARPAQPAAAVSSNRPAIVFARMAGEEAAAKLVQQVASNDATRGGRLQVVDAGDYFMTESGHPDFAAWRSKGAGYLVGGSIMRQTDGRYELRYRLWRVSDGTDLGGQSLVFQSADMRVAAHRAADWLQQQAVGVPGGYALRLASVSVAPDRYVLTVADSDGANAQIALTSRKPIGLPTWLGGQKVLGYVSFESGSPAVFVQIVATGARQLSSSSSSVLAACPAELAQLQSGADFSRDRLLRDDWVKGASSECVAAMNRLTIDSSQAGSASNSASATPPVQAVTITLDGKTFAALPDEKQVFESSLAHLRQADWTGGIKALTDLLTRYPNTGYRESALFWLGNAQYGGADYKASITSFRQLLSMAPEHKRAPDAMLSIANCYTEMRDPVSARKVLAELVKAYPDTEAAQAARERLQVKVRHGGRVESGQSS